MQISTIGAPAPATNIAPSTAAPAVPGASGRTQDPRIEGTPRSAPAAEFSAKHALDYLAMPGVYTVGWGSKSFDEFFVNCHTQEDAAQLAGILERQVGDIRIVLKYGPDRVVWDGTPIASAGLMLRGISAMPGVWFVDQRNINERGGVAVIRTINQSTTDRLDPLIKNRIEFMKDRQGRQRYISLVWRAGIPS
ncbi:MAG: hypothetical protein KDC46_14235 [Thermoleophilia bacterium]|nr:hypothetical protein [Thermoleophilia bacterium]